MKGVLVKVTGSAAVLVLLFWIIPWREIREPLARFEAPVWFGVWIAFVAGHGLGVLKWRSILAAGRASLSTSRAAACYGAGLFANLCLPSIVGGDVLRGVLAARSCGRGEAVTLGGVADRMLDLIALGVWMAVGGLLAGTQVEGWFGPLVWLGLALGGGGSIGGLLFAWRRPLARWPAKHRPRIGRTLVALRRLARSRSVAVRALLISLTIQGGFVLLNAWIGRTVGLEVPLAAYFLVWPLAKIAGLLPISLGGLGVRDGTYSALLVPMGAAAGDGLAASLIWQSILLGGGLVGGAVYWLRRSADDRTPESSRTDLMHAERSHV